MNATPTRAAPASAAVPPRRLRCPLRTIDNVQTELSRVYREARAGSIDIATASRLGNLLAILSHMIVDNELEARIVALEKANDGEG